ncbi:hypothetical protein ARAM_002506 [Aspergillus rambellii]|uniref:Uncharacterized protein n=1 Tax=Aspergillus rambellii TaxID=308745 RepID=A0A0F8URH2_9EURO|nr:hypothetical protein ARAM_002506 [Aspergillus rambellii]
MDELTQKRPQPDGLQSPALDSMSPSKRSPSDTSKHFTTVAGRREISLPTRTAWKAANSISISVSDDDDDDYTSSSGSSLSSSSDDDESDNGGEDSQRTKSIGDGDSEQMAALPARRKPNIRKMAKQPTLLSKLSAFLPQMKSANEHLQQEIAAGREKDIRLDNEDEEHHEGQYIEMNLGLGVLEEKRSDDEHPPSDQELEDANSSQETNLLDRLMGKTTDSSDKDKPSIQEMTG